MSSAVKIMDIAERRMRERGYNAVSFRDIAAEIGIKSASLHYHYPKKADLGEALVQRYTENFRNALESRITGDMPPSEKIRTFVDIYRHALMEEKLVCLCAVLGAEAPSLPDNVAAEVREFFHMNIDWLEEVFSELGGKNPKAQAQSTLAALEGAMIVASVNEDPDIFKSVANRILPEWIRPSPLPSQD